MSGSMDMTDEFSVFWVKVSEWLRSNWQELRGTENLTVPGPGTSMSTLGVFFGVEDGEDYADVVWMLPDDCYAVIDGDTYGQMFAVRIFRR